MSRIQSTRYHTLNAKGPSNTILLLPYLLSHKTIYRDVPGMGREGWAQQRAPLPTGRENSHPQSEDVLQFLLSQPFYLT